MTTTLETTLSIGAVVRQSSAVIQRNITVLGLLALAVVALPEAVVALIGLGGGPIAGSVGNIVSTITGAILQGAVMHAVVSDFGGRPVSFNEALNTGAKLFLPIWGLSIVVSFGVILGFLLLIVPGVILACMWCVAVPARVAEGPGVFAAAGRSAKLTKGHRWKIFLMGLLLVVAAVVVMAIAVGLATVLGRAGEVVVLPLLIAALGLVGSVFTAVLYTELRRIKEGVSAGDLASVFD